MSQLHQIAKLKINKNQSTYLAVGAFLVQKNEVKNGKDM